MPTLKPLNDHAKPLDTVAAKLRAHPYKWVRLRIGDRSRMSAQATSWKRKPPAAFGDGLFEFRTEKAGETQMRYYRTDVILLGRYIPTL